MKRLFKFQDTKPVSSRQIENQWKAIFWNNFPLDFRFSVFSRQPKNQTASVGGNVTFTCSARDSPAKQITWRKDGKEIVNGVRFQTEGTSTLNLLDVDEKDQGAYTCEVKTARGTFTSDGAYLLVKGGKRCSHFCCWFLCFDLFVCWFGFWHGCSPRKLAGKRDCKIRIFQCIIRSRDADNSIFTLVSIPESAIKLLPSFERNAFLTLIKKKKLC